MKTERRYYVQCASGRNKGLFFTHDGILGPVPVPHTEQRIGEMLNWLAGMEPIELQFIPEQFLKGGKNRSRQGGENMERGITVRTPAIEDLAIAIGLLARATTTLIVDDPIDEALEKIQGAIATLQAQFKRIEAGVYS